MIYSLFLSVLYHHGTKIYTSHKKQKFTNDSIINHREPCHKFPIGVLMYYLNLTKFFHMFSPQINYKK